MAEGAIKKLILEKQIGFIQPDSGGKDVFFHLAWLKGIAVQEGQRVEFDIEHGDKGPRARNIRILDTGASIKSPATADTTDKYRFLNPYNFVRFLGKPRPENHVLGNCPPPPHDRYVGLTGRITCTVEAVTPLFISDSHAIRGKDGEHRTYRFFQLDGKPALPASSLRGMVRSVFETVTNSCFAVFQKDDFPLEHRPGHLPGGIVPARVAKIVEDGAWLEILDARENIPFGIGSGPSLMPSAHVKAYEPRVIFKEGKEEKSYNDEKLPDWVRERLKNTWTPIRVAALIKKGPIPHKSRPFRFFEVEQMVPVENETALQSPHANLEKIYGWLYITGPNIENKHDERLFFRWDDKQANPPQLEDIPESARVKVSIDVLAEFEHHIRGYFGRLESKVKDPGNQRWPVSKKDVPQPSLFVREDFRVQKGQLVYAIIQKDTVQDDKVVALRPVCIPRLRYENTRQELLPNHLKERCSNIEKLCPACRVFGWVREGAQEINTDELTAYAGRLRFSHGTLTTNNIEKFPETTLAILSTPKPTATPFYLIDANGQPNPQVDYNDSNAKLRGHKFYRHHGNQLSQQEYKRAGDIKDDQNRTVVGTVKPGASFKFTIDFENLAPLELGALFYALELEEGMFHRLGYAKPLGFGSVKVTVKEVCIIDWEERLRNVEPGADWGRLENWAEYKAKFLQEIRNLYGEDYDNFVLADLRALLGEPPELPIHYPRSQEAPDPDGKNYEWFVGNKRRINARKRDKSNLPAPCALPLATEERRGKGLPLINKDGVGGSCE